MQDVRLGWGGHEGGQTYGACPKGWGSQAGCVDLGLRTSWENTGPRLEAPHVSIPGCSACPRLCWTPPCKLVLQSAALLTTCEAVCAWPSLSPLALARPMHRWAGCGPMPRLEQGASPPVSWLLGGQMAPGLHGPLPRTLPATCGHTHAAHTPNTHPHTTHSTHTGHMLYDATHTAPRTRHALNTHDDYIPHACHTHHTV